MNLRYLVVLCGLVALGWAVARWRTAVKLALVVLIFEGAMRKWLLPGAQDLVYFAKDVILLGAYAGFLNAPPREKRPVQVPPAVTVALIAGAAFGALQMFNPNLPNVLVGVLGFKAYFLYVPLLWVVPSLFPTDRDLARFLRRYILLAIPVGLLAVAQFYSPQESALNVYARGSGAAVISTFGSSTQVRVTGTFSYITGYTSYVLTLAILVLAVLAATRWRFRGNLATYAALVLTLLGMLMSGSRGPVLLLALLLPLYWWLSVARETGSGATIGRLLLGLSLVAMLVNYVGSDAVGAFYGRAVGSSDLAGRLVAPVVQPLTALEHAGVLGYGIGATHQTAAAVTTGIVPYSWLRGQIYEGEPGQIMLELGVVGFLLIYFVRIFLIFFALRQVFTLHTIFRRAIAVSCALFFLAHLPGGVVFNVTSDVYFWFFAGLLTTVIALDRAAARSPLPLPVREIPGARRRQQPLPVPMPLRPAPSAPSGRQLALGRAPALTTTASRVLVTHPGRQHSHQAALALARAGMLSGYWAGAPSLARHGRLVPRGLWQRFVRYAPVELPADRVRWHPWPPALRRLADAALPPAAAARVDFAACRLFDRWAARHLARTAVDAVIACEISALTTFQVARERGILTLLDAPSIHHAAQDRLHGFAEPARLHRRITAVKDREIELADAVLTVSELARATYLEAGVPPERVLAIPLGADTTLFSPEGSGEEPAASGREGGAFTFVFSGAMIRRKGFDLLLAAFDRVRAEVPDARLVIAGPAGEAAGALDAYDSRGIERRGSLPQAELARLFRAADCLVLPSRNDSYGMVVAEALACGLPVIASRMVGAKDLIVDGESGWVVPVDDVGALAERMAWCARHPAEVRAMRPACRRAAEAATWPAYQLRFAQAIAGLVAARPDAGEARR